MKKTSLSSKPLSEPDSHQPKHSKMRKLQGWRFGLAVSASAATLVLVTNVLLVIGAASASKLENGIGKLHLGNCDVVDRWNTALHLLINALSSLLLSASNYAMQCLSSPTRYPSPGNKFRVFRQSADSYSPGQNATMLTRAETGLT